MSINFIDCPQFLAELYNGDLMQIVPELEIHTDDLSRSRMMTLLADSEFVMNDHTYTVSYTHMTLTTTPYV